MARLVSQLKVAQVGHILFDGKVVDLYLCVTVAVKSKLNAVLEWLVGRRSVRAFDKFHSVSSDVNETLQVSRRRVDCRRIVGKLKLHNNIKNKIFIYGY